jgi:TP901 family phage tail tape measure protein
VKAFTIPTIYSAVDKFTAPLKRMGAAAQSFAGHLETGMARGERMFRKFTPVLGETGSQLLSFVKTAALAGAIIGGISFSGKALMDYEEQLQAFRTIVSSLSDQEFVKFEKAAQSVGKQTKKSAVDVLSAFEMIAGLNAKFAETPQAISQVTAAAITLSKASRDDLGKSAANLVGILNQFNAGAEQADRVINVLAAGQAVGASSITQTADALGVYGAIAKASNISIERSVALTEVLASKQIFASEAGTALRGSTLALQKAGLGYKSGTFDIVDALNEYNSRLVKLSTAKQKDAYATKVFGVINRTAGNILADNVKQLGDFEKAVTGTTEAQAAAAINSNTLRNRIDELKASWVNMLVSSDKAKSGLETAKNVMGFLARNMDSIVSIGTKILIFFAGWKALLIASRIALIAYNVVLGISGALSGTASVAIGANAVALGAYKVVLALVTAAQWAWNVAMTANPIGIIIVAIGALIALVAAVIVKWNEWGAALSLFMGPLGFIVSLVMSFARNWQMIKDSFKDGGILSGLKAIGKVILDAILMPVQQLVGLIAEFTGAEWAENAVKNIEQFRKNLGVSVDEQAVNPKLSEQDAMVSRMETVERQRIDLNIKDSTGRASMESSGSNLITPKFSSTFAGI